MGQRTMKPRSAEQHAQNEVEIKQMFGSGGGCPQQTNAYSEGNYCSETHQLSDEESEEPYDADTSETVLLNGSFPLDELLSAENEDDAEENSTPPYEHPSYEPGPYDDYE